jgi:uncharacterized protein
MPPLLLVFLKAPRVGSVKTRLAAAIGDVAAAAAYRAMVEHQLRSVPSGWQVRVMYTPADAATEMRSWLGNEVELLPQSDGDLGARLRSGFLRAIVPDGRPVIAIGGDCPALDTGCLNAAAAALSATDVVIGPARDGGYYLIGSRQRHDSLFHEIQWSSPHVLSQTLERARSAGLSVRLLEEKEDVDDAPAWQRWASRVTRHHVANTVPGAAFRDLSIVIPTWNEAPRIAENVTKVKAAFPESEILIVDGGSADETVKRAQDAGAVVIASERGRGVQCARGAEQAGGGWLLFLHADTQIAPASAAVARDFMDSARNQIATFRLRMDDSSWSLRLFCWFSRWDTVFTRFGDQGILVHRSFYRELGGFECWPLFEDVDLLRRARERTKVVSLPAYVITSARRFQENGILRQQFLNTRLLLRFLMGAKPEVLAQQYRAGREGAKPREGDSGLERQAGFPRAAAPRLPTSRVDP